MAPEASANKLSRLAKYAMILSVGDWTGLTSLADCGRHGSLTAEINCEPEAGALGLTIEGRGNVAAGIDARHFEGAEVNSRVAG